MDKKAYTILKKFYDRKWDPKTLSRVEPTITPEEITYVNSKNFKLGEETEIFHDDAVKRLKNAFQKVKLIDVSNAFLASIASRRLELRTGLAPYAYALNFPEHTFKPGEKRKDICKVCGMEKSEEFDFSEMWYRKFDWGNALLDEPMSPAFDLEFFGTLEKVQPAAEDFKIFNQIIDIIKNTEADTTESKLNKKLAPLLKGNKYLRQYFLETLGACSILETKEHKGFLKEFTPFWERQLRPHKYVECDPPLAFWKGSDGINVQALRFFFPQKEIKF